MLYILLFNDKMEKELNLMLGINFSALFLMQEIYHNQGKFFNKILALICPFINTKFTTFKL